MTETEELLCEMIRHPSVSGHEAELIGFLADAFAPVADEVELIPLPVNLADDPDYSSPLPALSPVGRSNLVVRLRGADGGGDHPLIFNTHADVVPAAEGQERAFAPYVEDGFIYGRGACDAKGQIAMLWTALRQLKAAGISPRGDVTIHIVVEEENGGNGTLALIRRGDLAAEGVVVLEPTDLRIAVAARGAVWFRATCRGRSGHVGSPCESVSALKTAITLTQVFEAYHARLLAASRGMPVFDAYENPMPLVFGRLESGTWPATVPARAVLEGVLGFLPNRTRQQVMAELRAAIAGCASASRKGTLAERCDLEFTFRHDACVTPPQARVTEIMRQAVALAGGGRPVEMIAMPASSDAWFYNNQLAIPTITFGVGKLTDAHTAHERVSLADLQCGADTVATFIRLFTE